MSRTELPPVDACPSCDPGIPGPSLPAGDPEPVQGGTLASYECEVCGMAWSTLFDEFGWPAEQTIAPVVPVRAA